MFNPKRWCAVAVALAIISIAPALADQSPITIDIKQLEYDRVLKAADQYLNEKPVTLTAYPTTRSAGGLHDYFSEADYFWPDPVNPNGPYINRDGMTDPANFNDHRLALIRMSIQVPALVAAYDITDENKYADHAIDHLRAWFVNEPTRMNPSLVYAQAIHNKVTGRSYGIIDTLHLVEVTQAINVLRQHHAIGEKDNAAINQWFADYLKWLTTHEFGITEGNSKNNHAVCYWLQVAAFSTLVDDREKLTESRKRYREQLLPQMAPDGSFPKELARTKPYGYSLFNLDQLATLCQIASSPADNLWAFSLPTGQSIAKGLSFMYPFVKDKSKWPARPDVMFYEYWPVRSQAWLFGGLALKEPKYIQLWKGLEPDPQNAEVLRNLPLRQPELWVNQPGPSID